MADSNLIYGHHPVAEAIRAGKAVEKVYFQQGIRGDMEKEFRHLTKEYGIPLQVVPREKLNKMTKGAHQGVVAYLALVEFQSLEDVLPFVFGQGETPLLVLLDGITDVRNFGAICRSAECSGAHAVVVPQSGSAPANEEAMKASAGALARIRVCRVRSMFSTVEMLQESGVQVVATALSERAAPVYEADLTLPTAILMGSEGEGVHPKLLKMADAVVRIPQATDFDSFNVSVATGIVLYEAMRQRLMMNDE
ncbi:MAG: 23S rRNA (guanosine(2251)-2'-O)-methyltransferase RlmB [Haliscomenobacteraceae bacterium CHB4]|nr:23S rRNA (guanosine-2'-O-)-methyltransferase RlmB [Saprospiraceae bacterium]MCE7924217.1 23S rRNA (guanosine(2251)-2'-O)-methyltransferase RlmB [Haliscomenobacteraceae bacterium CHB4]